MTEKRNKTAQNATSLTSTQEKAIQAMLSGETVTAAAKTAGVNRTTVHRWLNDPDFLAALNSYRSELRDTQHHRLARLASNAIDVVEQALEDADLRAALALLRGIGLLSGQVPPTGPTNADQIRHDQAEEKMNFELDQRVTELLTPSDTSAHKD